MRDAWQPVEPFACPRCGGVDWDSEPKWREATVVEHERNGWLRVPVLSPERSRCQSCGYEIVWVSEGSFVPREESE